MKINGIWQAAAIFTACLAAFAGFWYGVFLLCQVTGFELQTTPQYGFTSGIGPMIETALLGSTLVTGLWRAHNCHAQGCFRLGKHRVDGTPWCTEHAGSVPSRALGRTDHDLLEEICDHLAHISNALDRQ